MKPMSYWWRACVACDVDGTASVLVVAAAAVAATTVAADMMMMKGRWLDFP